jgi:hypothetical protein
MATFEARQESGRRAVQVSGAAILAGWPGLYVSDARQCEKG